MRRNAITQQRWIGTRRCTSGMVVCIVDGRQPSTEKVGMMRPGMGRMIRHDDCCLRRRSDLDASLRLRYTCASSPQQHLTYTLTL